MKLRSDLVHIGRRHVSRFFGAGALDKIAAFDDAPQFLDLVTVNGRSAGDYFESVVLGRIVAAGDHHGSIGFSVEDRVIKQRRRNYAYVGNIASGCDEAVNE